MALPLTAPRAALPKQLANFTNSTGGLDLTLRLIQAVAIVAAHVLVDNVDNVTIKRCWLAVSQLALARRYLRFFCFLDCFYNAHGLLTAESPNGGRSLLRIMELVESTLLGLYFVMEDLTMLHDMDIWQVPWYTPVLMEANKLWLYAIALSITRTAWNLVSGPAAQKEVPKANTDTSEKKAKPSPPPPSPSKAYLLKRIIVDCCDFTLPASFLGWVPLGDFGVGVAMTVSSVLAWPDLWATTQR
ncbi:hypothetical protein ACO1O0_007893 [Amphichorda felina]